ncbi:MAG: DMT family transporter [Myxococcaceae bacterium]|jgi:drug/metabolite transporter (DMT)-like permease|nr:DMT family transporter [Myxococcaceae bacterium]
MTPASGRTNALPLPVLAAVLGQTVISAGTHLAARRATQDVDAISLVTMRILLSALGYVALLSALKGPLLPPRATWRWWLGFGFLAGPINQGFFVYGLSRSKASHAALLYALTPVGVYLLSALRGRERVTAARLVGIGVAFGGVVVLLLGRGLGEALGPLVGDLFILGAVVAWVFWTAESRPMAIEHGGLRTAGWSLVAGALWCVPLAPFVVQLDAFLAAPAAAQLSLGYLVILTSMGSYALWNYALSRTEASRVAVFANLQPVATAVAAWALLDEPIGWELVVGGGLVLLGVRLAQR